jgi:transcriptional regulator with XRE-family HTH domain
MLSAAKLKETRKHFGNRLRQLRGDKGWSQEAFAEECGLHRTYIGGVERGERNISLDNIAKIAAALDVDIAALFKK